MTKISYLYEIIEYRNIDFNRHRTDGPALEALEGTKFWYKDGVLHREDGPACQFFGNRKNEYWINGEFVKDE